MFENCLCGSEQDWSTAGRTRLFLSCLYGSELE